MQIDKFKALPEETRNQLLEWQRLCDAIEAEADELQDAIEELENQIKGKNEALLKVAAMARDITGCDCFVLQIRCDGHGDAS